VIRVLLALGLVLLVTSAAAVVFAWWASTGWDGDGPEAARRAWILPSTAVVPRDPPSELRVMSWNIAFGGGLHGEPTTLHGRESVEAALAGIAEHVRAVDPDLLFLQEVDRPSKRSGDVDQLSYLIDALGYKYACFVTTWRVNYLPFPYWPPSRQLGGVHSGQAILSRFPITACERQPLPQPPENPSWYNRFFLHRSIQKAEVAIGGGRSLSAVNLHLEAFSNGNRQEQARIATAAVDGWTQAASDPLVIVAGDLNAVPGNAAVKTGFADEDIDFTGDETVALVRGGRSALRDVFLDDAPELAERASFTFPASAPTRRLDYVLYAGFGASSAREVLPGASVSDHLPLVATFPLDPQN
jgi:endonuclease/exonuclease/phosphatase family metal-dependent hydrolase